MHNADERVQQNADQTAAETAGTPRAETAVTPHVEPSRSLWKSRISAKHLTLFLAVLLAGAATVLMFPRILVRRHSEPPAEWKGIRLGVSRADIAQMLVDSGARWESIQKPGTAPTPWAAQVRLSVNGSPAKEFSVKFSDGQRWDYGRHPQVSDSIVDVDTLIGGLPHDATLNGVMWLVERSGYDLRSDSVPLEVLQSLGAPHSDKVDITGIGHVYLWEWPTLKAYYTTIDGRLAMQQPEPVANSTATLP